MADFASKIEGGCPECDVLTTMGEDANLCMHTFFRHQQPSKGVEQIIHPQVTIDQPLRVCNVPLPSPVVLSPDRALVLEVVSVP